MPTRLRAVVSTLCLAWVGSCAGVTAWGQACGNTQIGEVPLHDLGEGSYQGFQGGLYPGGFNMRPAAHDAAGLAAAQSVVPRAPDGHPTAGGGRIVVLAIGMSNTSIIADAWIAAASVDPSLANQVQLVNAAQSGQDASIISDASAAYWSLVDQRVAQAGATHQQVQVVWLLEAHPNPTLGFPAHAQALAADLKQILNILRVKFPNLAVSYLSSRAYGGYDAVGLSPEPGAYEGGFAVKWVIEQQIQGDPGLNHDPTSGPVVAPWIAWAAYTWADGLSPRSDLLEWECADFLPDGVHPSPTGAAKAGALLHRFFRTDATTRSWYVGGAGLSCASQAEVASYGSGAPAVAPPQLVMSALPVAPSEQPVYLHVYGAAGPSPGLLLVGAASFADGQVPWLGGSLLVDPLFVVPLSIDAAGKAWLPIGVIPDASALCGLTLHFQAVAATTTGAYGLTRRVTMTIGH